MTRPATGAVMMVRDRLASACASCACARLQLRLEHRLLFLGRDRVGLRGRISRLALLQVRGILLRRLHGPAALFGEQLIAIGLLLREGQRRLRLRRLLVGLIDLGLLRDDLRFKIVDARRHLIALGDIVAIVEPHQFGAGLDQLIVVHRDVDDRSGDLRADLHRSGIDESVVGPLIVPGVQPPEKDQNGEEDAANDNGDQKAPALARSVPPTSAFSRPHRPRTSRQIGRRIRTKLGVGAAVIVDALIHGRRLNALMCQ